MVDRPIVVVPLVWTFAPITLSQPLQNLAVKLAIGGLTRRYEFLVDSASGVGKKKDQHGLDIVSKFTRFFFSAAVNLATSTATTAASSQGHNHTPMFHHRL
jgi:hypothetical protein